MQRARTETFEHTISGLLSKRRDLLTEGMNIRDRLAEIRNDLAAIDRTLGVVGYKGDPEAMMPRQKRHVIFGQGELSKSIVLELRQATEPMTSRDIAKEIISTRGDDMMDRRYLTDLTKRVSKALRIFVQNKVVTRSTDVSGNYVWRLVGG